MNDHLLSIPGRLAPVFYSVSFPTSLRTTKRDAGGPRRVSSAIAYIQVALAIVLCGCRHDHNSAQVVQIQDQQPSLEYDLAQATPHPPGSLERNYDQGPWRPPATPQLVFSTYLGGSQPCDGCTDAHTFALNAASDALGNTYVTGATSVSDLPVLHAWQPQPAASSALSAFVAKYDPSGRPLWCTYLGGDKQTMGIGVAAT